MNVIIGYKMPMNKFSKSFIKNISIDVNLIDNDEFINFEYQNAEKDIIKATYNGTVKYFKTTDHIDQKMAAHPIMSSYTEIMEYLNPDSDIEQIIKVHATSVKIICKDGFEVSITFSEEMQGVKVINHNDSVYYFKITDDFER